MLSGMRESAPLHQRLLQEQVRLLASNVPALVVGTLLLAFGTAALLVMNAQPTARVGGWLAAMVLLCLLRWWLARVHGRGRPEAAQTQRWARLFVAASAAGGLLWGSLAWLFFTPQEPYTLVLVAMVLTAILSSATQSLGPYFPAHLGFALPCLLPFAVQCLLAGGAQLTTLGVLVLVFLVMAELFAWRISATIAGALRVRFENEALVEQVTAQKEKAEIAHRAKTRFLATASHDLRQPIHAMSMFLPALKRMAEEDRLSPAVVATIGERMQASLDVVGGLLNRLLDVSRLDADAVQVHKQDLELAPLLETTVSEVAAQCESKGLRLRMHDGGLWVHSDPVVLHTILSNLLGNAVRYTQQGGVLLTARGRGERVLLQVWDTGIGIAPDETARITEEFFQARNAHEDASQTRGFGLGLAIAHRSAQLLGAQLHWRSVLGRGSVFEIVLPRAKSGASAHTDTPAEPATPAGHAIGRQALHAASPGEHQDWHVLVVDEGDDILASMTLLLRAWGWVALPAHNLAEARAIAVSHGQRLHAALVDFHLTPQENGLAVVAMLREQVGADLPVAIITGDTTPEVMTAVIKARLKLLHKPAAADSLHAFIATARTPR